MSEHKSKISEETMQLKDKIKTGLAVDESNGNGSGGQTAYADNLPETVTMDQVGTIGQYNKQFIAATTLAFGELAVDAMVKNKDLTEATISIPMGVDDEVTHTVPRSKTFTNNFAKEGGPATVTKYGAIVSCYTVNAGKLGGDLKHARDTVREYAAEKISKC